MPTAVGPNTKGEENLVFGYDLGDVQNSYIGPPTKNQFGYQLSNGYLTSPAPVRANQNTSGGSNSWGHWGPSGTIGNYGSNTDRNFIYFDEYDYSHWFEATAASPNPYLFYQVLPFEGQQFGAVDPSWGGGNPNSNPRTMTFVLKLHDESEITNAKVSPTWNAHVSYYPTPTSSNTSPNQSTPWTSVTFLGDGWYKCVAANFVQSGANDLTGIWVKPGYKCYVGFAQQEEHPFSTALTDGTRSATESLLDLTNNSTADISNVSFGSNAQMTFDGSDDYVALPTGLLDGTGDFAIEAVVQADATETGGTIFGNYPSGNLQLFYGKNFIGLYLANNSTYLGTSPWNVTLPEFTTDPVHLVATRTGSAISFYINGVLKKVGGSSSTIGSTSATFRAGTNTNTTEQFNGDIFLLKVYNRTFTAEEVVNNYNAVKGRFNI